MALDHHFSTGEYEPRRYWDRRAERCCGDLWRTVCGFDVSVERNRAMDRIQRFLLARYLGHLLAGRRVLDFGCGVGRLTGWFLARRAVYTGVDVSPKMVSSALRRHPDTGFSIVGDTALPFADGSFDVAVTVTVLQHNAYQRQDELLFELLRVIRPGGHLMLLERIGDRRRPETLFTLYPRPLEEWLAEVTRGGETELAACRPVRWWITADAAARVARGLGVQSAGRLEALDRVLVPLGSLLDPLLLRLLPAGRSTTAAMLFRKTE